MPTFEISSRMPVSREALADYHTRPGALERLIPPWETIRIESNEGPLVDGKRVTLAMKIGPVWKRWVAEHFDVVPGERFRDRQVSGPFKSWIHTHEFADVAGGSVLTDRVEYELPFGAAGRLGAGYVRGELDRMFAFRHARTRRDLQRQAKFYSSPRLRVAVTGASGAVAGNLMPLLTTAGHSVARLVRGKAGREDIAWDAKTGELDRAKLAACDAIVHLAGKNIATRWSDSARKEIHESRVTATRKLCETLAHMPVGPRLLVSASAIGFYGDRGDELLDEMSPRGNGFAAELCEAWEHATAPARDAGIRVVNLRIGVVLSANSGALLKMLTPAKLGLAGRVGSGRQWMPWIAMDDLIGVIHEAIFRDDVHGTINAVTGSVRQAEFIDTLGHVLRRPTVMPLPAAAVRAMFGQMGDELLLASANVQPRRLREANFEPTLPTVESALRFELGRFNPDPALE